MFLQNQEDIIGILSAPPSQKKCWKLVYFLAKERTPGRLTPQELELALVERFGWHMATPGRCRVFFVRGGNRQFSLENAYFGA